VSIFTSGKVEIEWTPGTWTDVTAYYTTDYNPVVVKGGRANEYTLVTPGSIVVDLINIDGRFTPDNASGAYYPNVVEGIRLRFSVTKAGISYVVGTYYISSWEISFGTNGTEINDAIATVTALDSLGQLALIPAGSAYQAMALANATANGTWCDYFPCESVAVSSMTVNTNSPSASQSTGSFEPSWANPGGTLNGLGPLVESNDAVLSTGGVISTQQVMFPPTQTNTSGACIYIYPRTGLQAIELFLKFNLLVNGVTTPFYFMRGSTMQLKQYGLTTSQFDFYNQGTGTSWGTQDQLWHKWSLVVNSGTPTTTDIYLDDILQVSGQAFDLRTFTLLVLSADNGHISATVPAGGAAASWAGITVTGAKIRTTTSWGLAAGTGWTVATRLAAAESAIPFAPGFTAVGVDSTRACVTGQTNTMNALQALQAIQAGNGGIVWARTDGTVLLMHPDALYPLSPLCTVDSEGDAGSSIGAAAATAAITTKRSGDTRPTRITITSPATSVTAIDTVAEATGLSRSMSVTTMNATPADALSVGWSYMACSNANRLTQLSIDLVSASTDWTSTLLSTSGTTGNLWPTQRLRVKVPSAVFGVSTKDVFVQGWTLTMDAETATLAIDCSAATSATVTGGTCVGNTSTGTVIITSDRTWTTVAQAYPMDLDWSGERITVSAPGGSSSPQTFTVTARGVTGGTAATSHSSGTSIDVWHASGA
jgi:hypothetical protein